MAYFNKKVDLTALCESKSHFEKNSWALLRQQIEVFSDTKPLANKKLIHNIPLTIESVFKILPLLAAGADLVVRPLSFLKPESAAISLLQEANIAMVTESASLKVFDIHLDCCAELASLTPPQYGAVELTQTGTERYRDLKTCYPVISVDDSPVKKIECLGTGEAFVHAFKALTKEKIRNKKFIVFGYGKVGQGIALALKACDAEVVVVEKDRLKIKEASTIFEHVYSIDEQLSAIKKALKTALCLVTVTGKKAMVESYFNTEEVKCKYLVNMGAVDEFGDSFPEQSVLHAKNPINFAVPKSTPMCYLDPIFYAHNQAAVLLVNHHYQSGMQPFPAQEAAKIIDKWYNIHPSKKISVT